MLADQLSIDSHLLSLCLVLRWFDRDVLATLGGYAEGQVEALLSSDLITAAPTSRGAFQLRDDVRIEVLERLRADRPGDELALHERAFDYFLQRMHQPVSPERRILEEETCFYHLGELRMMLMERREWQMLKQYIAAARAAAPQQKRHLHSLALYDGFVAIRTQEYDLGERTLGELSDKADVETDIRMLAANYLAQSQWYQTHYDRALLLYQHVQALAQSIGNYWYQGAALLNMSLIYHEIGYYERALDLSTQSLLIFRELRDTYREAHATYEVGKNAMQLGRWEVAQQHFHEADRLYMTLGVPAQQANLYCLQGILYHELGDEMQSEANYLRSLEIAQSPEHGDIAIAMDIWLYLGFLSQTQGRWDAALSAYERAANLAGQLRNQHTLTLIHYRRGNVFARQGRIASAFAAYKQAIDGIEALRGATESEEIKIGLLGTTQQIYEAMVLLCLAQGRDAEAFDYVERARSRALLDILAKKSPELYDALDQPIATLAEVQSRLPEDALLLEYFTTGVLPRGESLINQLPPENTRLREHLTLPPRTIIFAVTRDHLEVVQPALDPNTLRPQPGDPGPGRRLLYPERRLAQLYDRLIAPVAQLLRGRRLLYLIPHGPLHYVPFMALRAAAGAYLLDADGPAIARAPSATILLRNCLGRPARQAGDLLALGYNDTDRTELRYAEAEARLVADLLGGQAWTGPDAKRARLAAEGQQARWLHFSGHAIYNPHDPLDSHLRLGAGDSLSARAIMGELDLRADIVTLSACMSGLSYVVPGDELLGLQRAFLYAGAPAVVCTLWEADDLVALLVMERFYTSLRQGKPAAAALRDAQVAVRRMTGRDLQTTIARWRREQPAFAAALDPPPAAPVKDLDAPLYADPFYWAPFMLIGRPD